MIQVYIALAVAVASFAAGWQVNGWKNDAAALAAKDAVEEARKAFTQENTALGERLEARLQNLKVVNRTINNEVQREVQTKTVYVDKQCAVPDSGVSLLNAARGYTPGAAAGERPGAMPAAPAGTASPTTGR